MNEYDEIASAVIDVVLEKIEELYPELKPKREFVEESKDASILFGVAYYDVECQISDMLKEFMESKHE